MTIAVGLTAEWQMSRVGLSTNSGRRIAAQTGAITILAAAGVLRGKRYATLPYDKSDKIFQGAVYAGQGVIRDLNIITSSNCPNVEKFYVDRYPDGTMELTRTLIRVLKGI